MPHLYDKLGRQYSALITADPIKKYAQYPSVLKCLGDLDGKSVLDIGCGDGVLSRAMSERGARVTAFDISREQIELAKKLTPDERITYSVSSPAEFRAARNSIRLLP